MVVPGGARPLACMAGRASLQCRRWKQVHHPDSRDQRCCSARRVMAGSRWHPPQEAAEACYSERPAVS